MELPPPSSLWIEYGKNVRFSRLSRVVWEKWWCLWTMNYICWKMYNIDMETPIHLQLLHSGLTRKLQKKIFIATCFHKENRGSSNIYIHLFKWDIALIQCYLVRWERKERNLLIKNIFLSESENEDCWGCGLALKMDKISWKIN